MRARVITVCILIGLVTGMVAGMIFRPVLTGQEAVDAAKAAALTACEAAVRDGGALDDEYQKYVDASSELSRMIVTQDWSAALVTVGRIKELGPRLAAAKLAYTNAAAGCGGSATGEGV